MVVKNFPSAFEALEGPVSPPQVKQGEERERGEKVGKPQGQWGSRYLMGLQRQRPVKSTHRASDRGPMDRCWLLRAPDQKPGTARMAPR